MFTIVMITLAILQVAHVIDLTMKTWMILIAIFYIGLYIVGWIVEAYTDYKD